MAPSPQLAAPVPYLRIVVADGELFRPSLRAAKRSALRACCRGQAWGEVRRAFANGCSETSPSIHEYGQHQHRKRASWGAGQGRISIFIAPSDLR